MPIHVEELRTELAMFDGELPLSEAQLAKLVALIGERLAESKRDSGRERGLPRRSVVPRLKVRG